MRSLVAPFRIANGQRFRLRDIDPDDTGGIPSKDKAADRPLHSPEPQV